MNMEESTINMVIVGEPQTGKTSIIRRYMVNAAMELIASQEHATPHILNATHYLFQSMEKTLSSALRII